MAHGTSTGSSLTARSLGRAVAAIVARPGLWRTGLTQVFVLARPGWWRRWPPLPAPDADYLRFRMQTMYGDAEREPDPGDVVTYLEWCREWRKRKL